MHECCMMSKCKSGELSSCESEMMAGDTGTTFCKRTSYLFLDLTILEYDT